MERLRIFLIFGFGLVAVPATGQLSPPGLDGARLVSWGAIGFSQQFSNRFSATIYVGGSAQSDPDNLSTFKKPAIFVLNQETLYQFNTRWQLAFCTSLRQQFVYEEDPPYSFEEPPWRREIRYYLRLFHRYQKGKAAWTFSFRPEYRTFFTPDGDPWASPVQIRLRAKIQVSIPLNESKTNSFVAANEWLGATSEDSQLHWSSFEFTEDRLSTFFRHAFKKPQVFLDLGLMHQLWKDERKNLQYSTYFSFDLLFQNPFGQLKKK
ncbi:MAG TPA: DUF2490 domain-containing protein [Cyclobacteriaceae bacterium]|nr:DUF2490 domain-containing protein [Cyclobacteriaceae bacterium]